jgi:hypothetical protein
MSVPIRRFAERPEPPPRRRPKTGATRPGALGRPEGVEGAKRPPRRVAAPARRSGGRGFVVLASALVGSLVFGIVILNVLLAQASFHLTEAERRLEALTQEHLVLVRQQATLSAPDRIAAWAARHDMRLPDELQILHVTGGLAADPAGAESSAGSAGGPGEGEDPDR